MSGLLFSLIARIGLGAVLSAAKKTRTEKIGGLDVQVLAHPDLAEEVRDLKKGFIYATLTVCFLILVVTTYHLTGAWYEATN